MAGVAAYPFAAVAADALNLSPIIAGTAAGLAMAVLVGIISRRQPPAPPA
jgi:hypothetical protein